MSLFPPQPERQTVQRELSARLREAAGRVRAGPVTPDFDHAAFAQALAAFDFAAPMPLHEAMAWTIAQLEHGIVHIDHPRYFGLFNPAPSFPAQCAEQIVAAFNPQLATATTSPAAVAIEAHVASAVAARLGLPPGAAGHFTSGGSEANYTALICALTEAEPRFAGQGARGFSGAPVFYVSADCHLAWIKIAHMAGIGRAAARLVATDGGGRMDIGALRLAIAADLAAGCVPVMIGATAGTTNAGMIDDLPGCAAAARDYRLWLHVDAAWGGAAAASPRFAHVLDGIGLARSVTIDAHKWLATTMGCGLFLTTAPEAAAAAFGVSADFMPSHAPSADPYMTTTQWSRRFLGLRLFLSLAAGGWAAHAAHVEQAIALAARLQSELEARGWAVLNKSPVAVICAAPPAGSASVRVIVDRVVASGAAWVSVARFEGREVLRACVTHGETLTTDIAAMLDALDAARR